MKSTTKAPFIIALGLAAVLLAGCQTADTAGSTSSSNTTSSGERVNTLPWSRPESWEGQGPLGAAMQQRDPNMY